MSGIVKMNQYKFIINKPVQVEETRHYEFKEVKGKNPLDSIKNTCDEYVVAFLNSDGGRIFWGIRDSDRLAVGVKLTLEERDDLRKTVTSKLSQIQPPISPTAYQVNLHPIFEDESSDTLIEDRYVVEIVAPRVFNNDLYSTGSGEVFVKTDSGKKKLSFQEIQDEIRRRQIEKRSLVSLTIEELGKENFDSLRILYFQAYLRSTGFDYLKSPRLVAELRERGHKVRLCWAVNEPLNEDNSDDKFINKDLISLNAVRDWQPQVIIFENGLFVGQPRMPLTLLEELENNGSVVILEVSDYTENKDKYEDFLKSRGVEVEKNSEPNGEQPACKAFFSRYLNTSVDELRQYSIYKDENIYRGVNLIAADWAYPVRSGFFAKDLVVGGEKVFVKAYRDERLHQQPYPVYGVLVEHNFLTEAIFFGGIIFDLPENSESFDNHIYLANLSEWLYQKRNSMFSEDL